MQMVLKPSRRIVRAVQETVLRRETERASSTNYFILEQVLLPEQELPIPRQKLRVTRPTLMVFAERKRIEKET